ncbi:MAG: hypothetical protein KM296_00300 [Brockia lithotrophica]|nr:hypothetical protein [Brockia lithotrophica]
MNAKTSLDLLEKHINDAFFLVQLHLMELATEFSEELFQKAYRAWLSHPSVLEERLSGKDFKFAKYAGILTHEEHLSLFEKVEYLRQELLRETRAYKEKSIHNLERWKKALRDLYENIYSSIAAAVERTEKRKTLSLRARELVDALERGEITPDDLDAEIRQKLIKLLGGGEGKRTQKHGVLFLHHIALIETGIQEIVSTVISDLKYIQNEEYNKLNINSRYFISRFRVFKDSRESSIGIDADRE